MTIKKMRKEGRKKGNKMRHKECIQSRGDMRKEEKRQSNREEWIKIIKGRKDREERKELGECMCRGGSSVTKYNEYFTLLISGAAH